MHQSSAMRICGFQPLGNDWRRIISEEEGDGQVSTNSRRFCFGLSNHQLVSSWVQYRLRCWAK
nr:hypothetical protein A6C57_22705 [Fibrella sp. ES10-3-2-2]